MINKVADNTCDIGLVGTKTAETNCEFLPVASDELVIATHCISVPIKASRTR